MKAFLSVDREQVLQRKQRTKTFSSKFIVNDCTILNFESCLNVFSTNFSRKFPHFEETNFFTIMRLAILCGRTNLEAHTETVLFVFFFSRENPNVRKATFHFASSCVHKM